MTLAWSSMLLALKVPALALALKAALTIFGNYLVQLPVLPIISSMSFYPNIPIIHITLDQGPMVSNSLFSMMIVILLTECFLDRPTRYLCDC